MASTTTAMTMSELDPALPPAPSGIATADAPGLPQLRALAAALELDPPCTTFYFLRHGQTARNQQRIFQTPDEPLSARGIGQAQVAAALLAHERINSIVTSDLPRAVLTAHIVAQARPGVPALKPREQASLRERNFGALIGTSSRDLDWACAPENGELLGHFVERTRRALIAALADAAPVLIVAHGGTLHVLAALLGVAVNERLLANAVPLRFVRVPSGWSAEPIDPAGTDAGAQIS